MALHIADITMLYAPASGGVRTFLEAKADWMRSRPGMRHSLLVPGDTRHWNAGIEELAGGFAVALAGRAHLWQHGWGHFK